LRTSPDRGLSADNTATVIAGMVFEITTEVSTTSNIDTFRWKTSRINPSFLDVVPSSSKIFWPAVETETGSGSLLADRKMQIFIQDIKNGANIFERVIQMKRYPQTIHSIRSDDVSRR